ncbi:MAG: hypothetical protein PHC89_00065 [Candidatus Pacebacteria bacterium]|nr:hypothetical protein [Candidatus Paceibacterota bacterium]
MNKYVKILLVASSLFFGGAGILSAQEIEWSEPFADPSGYIIEWGSVTYGNNTFVAVGYNYNTYKGMIMTSSDGTTWSGPFADPSENNIYWGSVTYGNNTFVAVGYNGGTGKGMTMYSLNNEIVDSSVSKHSSIFGTRFCSDTVTTFCRPKSGFINNIPLISIYTELLGLYQQLLSAMQGGNSL